MRLHLGYILGLFAIGLAASAGYISVIGWGKLFAGEATIVMIVMGIIESAKLVTTIYLHRYNKKLPRPEGRSRFTHFFKRLLSLKTYLVIGVMATMFLTSVGIYGFLTGAYQETANKLELHDGEIKILEGKRDIYQAKIDANKELITNKNNRSQQLADLRVQQEKRLQELIILEHWVNARKTREEIEAANEEIQELADEVDLLVQKNSDLADEVSIYQVQILELEGSSDIAAEIGPLKYISSLTGRPMGSIINWIVLVIIFIFDPMAISLLLASNKVFEENAKNKDNDKPPSGDKILDDPVVPPVPPVTPWDGISTDLPPFVPPSQDDLVEPVDIPPSQDEEDARAEALAEFVEEEVVAEFVEEQEVIINNRSDERKQSSDEEVIEEPEQQIEENKQKIKDGILNKIKKKFNTKPVVPTGNVKREEIKEIKEGTRGYSVEVPDPKRVGTNKEVRNGEPDKFYFRRPNDE